MSDRIEAVREMLRHVREALPSWGLEREIDANFDRLANALDVLTGEVERLTVVVEDLKACYQKHLNFHSP